MKRLILICFAMVALDAVAQFINFNPVRIPQYAASSSGGNNRMPVVYRARITGLLPNKGYKYITRGITSSDFGSSALIPGAGNPMFLDSGSWKTTSAPSFNTGANHDTIYSDGAGEYEGWFGFIVTNDSRFDAGKNVYPSITVIGIGSNDTFSQYCMDSIHMLKFATNKTDSTGTGLYGHSMAAAKSFVGLYDDYNGFGRPLCITMIENDGMSIGSSAVAFYKNNVDGVAGNWGVIIPNNLANGVRKIENYGRYNGFPIYNNQDADGVWGPSSKNTVNPTGGTTAIAFDENDAALVLPEVQFWARTSTVSEGVGTAQVFVVRRYSSDKNQSVRLSIVGGTATSGGTDYTLSTPKTINFTPGGQVNDTTKITIVDDNSSEGDENIVVRLDNAVNCVIGTEVAHTMTITDNDIASIKMGSTKVVVKEDVGTVNIKVKIDKAVGTTSTMKMFLKTKADSSIFPGEFRIGSGTDTTFSLGKTNRADSVLIPCKVINDANPDPNDTFVLVIRQISGIGKVTDSLVTVVVRDNDGPAQVKFIDKTITVQEKTTSVKVRIAVPFKTDAGGDFTLRLLTGGTTATQGQDFTFSPSSKVMSIDTTTKDTIIVDVPLTDDNNFEPTENIMFGLGFLSNVKILSDDTLLIRIINDDYPIYPIGTINSQKLPNRVNDSLNVLCRIRGIVHSTNMRTAGLQFTLIDATGGISIMSTTRTFGYTPVLGDSVIIQGVVKQSSGMGEFQSLDTIIKLGSGKTLQTPTVVKDMTEANESKMTKVNRVKIVNTASWPTTALAANTFSYVSIRHTDGTLDSLYIDAETNIDGTAAPTGYINVTGTGGQIDGTSPFTSFYHLAPRALSDIEAATLPTVQFLKVNDTITELADSFRIEFTTSALDENYTYDVVVKQATAVSPKDYNYTTKTVSVLKNNSVLPFKVNISDDTESDGPVSIEFALRNLVGPGAIGKDSVLRLIIKDNEPAGVKKFATGNIKMYPNPASGKLVLQGKLEFANIQIIGLDGRVVLSENNSTNAVELNIAHISAGVYTVRVIDSNGAVYSEPVVIQ
ncbi:MAG: T9SS type A sorting domain-containing protein [Bacteroidia bacterium]|nr:T9SS type A sorting domain-containing protein [Bacteroidia bacterium]